MTLKFTNVSNVGHLMHKTDFVYNENDLLRR